MQSVQLSKRMNMPDISKRRKTREATFVVSRIDASATLSRREADVLRLLGDGKTTSEIAAKLKISLKTVNEYCVWLKKKLDAPKFNQLLRIAVLWRAGVAEIVVRSVRGE
jgi:DNA-binding CsgD family transcriptional regulator